MATAIVFDLDGTLVDSLADIAAAANLMLAELDLAPLPLPTIKSFVGNGLPKLVERVMIHHDIAPDRHAELTQVVLRHYSGAASVQTRPYPNVMQALKTLQQAGFAMGVCTNKPEGPARHILETLSMDPFFDVVIGGDTLDTRKPDPSHLTAAFKALGAHQSRIFIGDSEVDAETASRAQVPFLLFSDGYRKSPLSAIAHSASFDDFTGLPDLIRETIATHPD